MQFDWETYLGNHISPAGALAEATTMDISLEEWAGMAVDSMLHNHQLDDFDPPAILWLEDQIISAMDHARDSTD